MSKKEKKQNEKNDNENELEEAMAQLTLNNQQLQGTAQQLNQYFALCGHYEQTINVMSGRIQEMKQQISNLAQQQNSD